MTKTFLSPAPLEPAEYTEKANIDQNAITKSIRQIICVSFFSANSAASARDICLHFFIIRIPKSAMHHVGCMAALNLTWFRAHSSRVRKGTK